MMIPEFEREDRALANREPLGKAQAPRTLYENQARSAGKPLK
jgi:hypothetical protein